MGQAREVHHAMAAVDFTAQRLANVLVPVQITTLSFHATRSEKAGVSPSTSNRNSASMLSMHCQRIRYLPRSSRPKRIHANRVDSTTEPTFDEVHSGR